MINNVNNQRFKTIQNYSNMIKKPSPISILTAENTIFIKTNQNTLTSNYLRNGNQIKQKKNLLNSTINQTQKINNTLKNTFYLKQSNLIANLDKKNINEINNKLNETLKNKKIKRSHYRGTHSFIKMDQRGKNNLSSVNTFNSFNSNHLFNFYKMTTKLNNSSVKGKHKTKNKLNKEMENNKININENNFNSTYTIGVKSSALNRNKKKKNKSISKKIEPNMNKTTYFKKLNYSNNLSNLITSSNHDNIYFRTINSYLDKEKDNITNRIKRQYYYSRKANKKYIYSVEKKKEKSLAEKRQKAKKPISYLIKNNYLNVKDNPNNINRIEINLNHKKNDLIKSDENISKRKNNRKTNYKKIIYNLDNYNYTTDVENKEKIKNRKILGLKSIELNNDDYNKTSTNYVSKLIKYNKDKKDITNNNNPKGNNNIINNNYYNINNTFIFDTVGNKINQYDLTKLIAKNTKDPSNINYTELNNYNSNVYKTIDVDIEKNKNNIIKNLNKNNKNEVNPNKIKKIKSNNFNFIKLAVNNKNNNNNKQNCKKLTNLDLSNLIKDKMGKNYLQILSIDNKLHLSNIINKGITKNNNTNNNTIDKITNEPKKIKINNRLQKKSDTNVVNFNKEKTLNFKNNLNLNNNKITLDKKYNNNSLYQRVINRKKSDNVGYISKYMKLNAFNNFEYSSSNNTNSNSIKNKRIISKNKKDKKDLNVNNDNNIRQNKIISYKILNYKGKNKSYNIEKFNKLNIKGDESFEPKRNNDFGYNDINNNKNANKIQNKILEENVSINNFFFDEFENYEVEFIVDQDEDDKYIQENIIKKKKKKQNSSFELISLNEGNTSSIDKKKNEENDDNFDNINSIIKKIDFNEAENKDMDIFSLNNKKFREFGNIFDKRYENWIKN